VEFTRGQVSTRRLLRWVGVALAVLGVVGLVQGVGAAGGLLLLGLLLVLGAHGSGPERIVVAPEALELHDRRGEVRRFARAEVRRAEIERARLVIETTDGDTVREVLGYHRIEDLRTALAGWAGAGPSGGGPSRSGPSAGGPSGGAPAGG
jgi:hypothetical protein